MANVNMPVVHAQKPIPPYAKWGRLAVQKTKEKYPKANVIDYLHIGREKKKNTDVEKFKLWLKEGQKEYGVFVFIEFNPKTDRVKNITFIKTSR
ncbi:DUF3889 domain-containing protein [Falsibacillus albus]